MTKLSQSISILYILILVISGCNSSNDYPNLYWPGDFEQGLYGGNFSKALNVVVDNTDNATENGQFAWRLPPKTYQHLELLTEGTGNFYLGFKAKAAEDLAIVVKVVYKDEHDSTRTAEYPVNVIGDSNWHDYSVDYELEKPYPGPRTGEVLITCWNPGSDAWIDDVVVRRAGPDKQIREEFNAIETKAIRGGDFEEDPWVWISNDNAAYISSGLNNKVLKLGTKEAAAGAVNQLIDASSLAGKKIRLTADVGFLTVDEEDAYSWAGILLTLRNGRDRSSPVLASDPSPLWCPLGLAPPPGKMKSISAVYDIPVATNDLFLMIENQPRSGNNAAIIDNVKMEVLEN